MLFIYRQNGTCLERATFTPGDTLPVDAVWLDLVAPTIEEDRAVEALIGIAIPTREEMQEIEVSSRLYVENGARYMTAVVMSQSDTPNPRVGAVTFILAGGRLVTVRYEEPRPFSLVSAKLGRACPLGVTGETVLMELLEAVIDRLADILERIGADIDAVSLDVFQPETPKGAVAYRRVLQVLGRKGDLSSKVRDSLVSIGRVLLFLANEAETMKWPKDRRAELKGMQRDVTSLSDHVSYLSQKTTFLLDAVVGMVSIEQNNIIKLFSVAAVVFMPPTLVASIYGMNFDVMPELKWTFGYPLALVMMVAAAVVPYLFFKWKRWL